MSKRRLDFHTILFIASAVIGGLSVWETGLVTEGKSHPNFTAIAMVFMMIGQIAALKPNQDQKK